MTDLQRKALEQLQAVAGDLSEAFDTAYAVIPVDRDLAEGLRRVPPDILERELALILPHLRRVARVHGR